MYDVIWYVCIHLCVAMSLCGIGTGVSVRACVRAFIRTRVCVCVCNTAYECTLDHTVHVPMCMRLIWCVHVCMWTQMSNAARTVCMLHACVCVCVCV